MRTMMEIDGLDQSLLSSREAVLSLMQEKASIEAEIIELQNYLSQQNNIGMSGPLVDTEGFPRNDIDVYQVRHARHKIICLQTDHKAVMLKIEEGLHNVHSEIRKSGVGVLPAVDDTEMSGDPFVRVNFVAPNSPADIAGLQVDDAVIEFGSVNSKNFQGLLDVNKVVQASVNIAVKVKVLRSARVIALYLTPKAWSGRGLLGCNIIPVESVER